MNALQFSGAVLAGESHTALESGKGSGCPELSTAQALKRDGSQQKEGASLQNLSLPRFFQPELSA
jgi:hypothetical protein